MAAALQAGLWWLLAGAKCSLSAPAGSGDAGGDPQDPGVGALFLLCSPIFSLHLSCHVGTVDAAVVAKMLYCVGKIKQLACSREIW